MEKKVMLVIGLMILLGSCGELRYGIEKTVFEMEQDKETKEMRKKNVSGAILNNHYKEKVEESIKDIDRRNIDKRVKFENITLLIPSNTEINFKNGTIIDLRTGYGLPIYFVKDDHCNKIEFTKKVNGEYYRISYYGANVNNLAQKIIRANGFTKTCSK